MEFPYPSHQTGIFKFLNSMNMLFYILKMFYCFSTEQNREVGT